MYLDADLDQDANRFFILFIIILSNQQNQKYGALWVLPTIEGQKSEKSGGEGGGGVWGTRVYSWDHVAKLNKLAGMGGANWQT